MLSNLSLPFSRNEEGVSGTGFICELPVFPEDLANLEIFKHNELAGDDLVNAQAEFAESDFANNLTNYAEGKWQSDGEQINQAQMAFAELDT